MVRPGPRPAVADVPEPVARTLDPATRQVLADPGWRRLHPVTPVLRAWKVGWLSAERPDEQVARKAGVDVSSSVVTVEIAQGPDELGGYRAHEYD